MATMQTSFLIYTGPYLLVLRTGDLRSQFDVWVNPSRNRANMENVVPGGVTAKVDACTKHASGAGGSLARGGATSCRMSSPAKIELVAVI